MLYVGRIEGNPKRAEVRGSRRELAGFIGLIGLGVFLICIRRELLAHEIDDRSIELKT